MPRARAAQREEIQELVAMCATDPTISNTAIAERLGRDDSTISRWRGDERYGGLISAYRKLKSHEIIDGIDCVRRAYLAHAAEPAIIEKMSGLQAVTSFAILTDKLMLESGRPTSINLNASVDATLPTVLDRLRRALDGRQPTTSGNDALDVTPVVQTAQRDGA